MTNNTRRTGLVFACGMLTAGLALADVTVEQKMSVSGAGMMRMANMTGTTKTIVSGTRSRSESELRFENAMMRTFARGAAGKSVEIVDLASDRIYMVDPGNKSYTEGSFTERRAEMQKAMQAMQQGQASQQQGTTGIDESQCEWLPAKSDLQHTGEKSTIAGHGAERVIVTASQPCRDRMTGTVCEFGLTLDQWMASDFKESDEMIRYQQAYAEKLGITASGSKDFAERAEAMFGRYEGIWKEVAVKMQDLKGYPLRQSFALGVGGAQCQAKEQQSAASQGGGTATPSVGGAIMQGALGGLGGMFGRKKGAEKGQEPAAAAPAPAANGFMNFMTVSTELVSVTSAPAPTGSFEVPAGFRRSN